MVRAFYLEYELRPLPPPLSLHQTTFQIVLLTLAGTLIFNPSFLTASSILKKMTVAGASEVGLPAACSSSVASSVREVLDSRGWEMVLDDWGLDVWEEVEVRGWVVGGEVGLCGVEVG